MHREIFQSLHSKRVTPLFQIYVLLDVSATVPEAKVAKYPQCFSLPGFPYLAL
jgi:hypothetical protein